jgi:hypothetical protein
VDGTVEVYVGDDALGIETGFGMDELMVMGASSVDG